MKQGWTYKKLGDIAEIIHGKNQKDVISEDGQYPIYGSGGNIMGYARDYLCEANTTILGRKGSINNPQFITTRFWNVDTAFGIFAKSGNDSKFIYYFIKSIDWSKKNTGTTLPSLTQQVVKSVELSVPPLSEQERIVERLDAAFAQIDELKSNAERQLAEARALFQSALTQAMQPKPGWQEIAFKDICSFVRGPFGGSLKKECFKESGYAVYEQQNAIYNKFSFRYFIDEEKYESMKRFSVNPGDLIMSCSGTIGKVAIIPDDAKQGIINQALLKLTPSQKINKYYLKYLMESELFKELIRSYSDGAAIQNIASVSILKEILLRIPSVSEQQRIVEYNDSLTASFNEIEDNFKQTATECDALKQALLRQIFE